MPDFKEGFSYIFLKLQARLFWLQRFFLASKEKNYKNKSGLGLGIFIGGTLLERNFAKITFRNSITRNGAEVIIRWNNNDLIEI